MRVNLEPGSKNLEFETCSLEVEPNSTVEHLLSLLSFRHNTLDPTKLYLVLKGKRLGEDVSILDAGIQDEDTLTVHETGQGSCCALL